MTVVSSIRARELNLSADQSLGLVHLQKYLDFAERGVAALGLGRPTAPTAMHGLQADVLGELKKLGYDAVPDVGCGANRVDLGIHLPQQPGEFVLGIEFDGPDYDETGTARDRDRLRPEVLQNLGWKLHQIWSPDWVFRKQEEIERLKKALAEAPASK